MVWGLEDMTVMDIILLLKQKGFKEIEPCYFTLCENSYNYFVHIDPSTPTFYLYVLDENDKIDILLKDTIPELFYNDINRRFDNNFDYYDYVCLTTRFMDLVYSHAKLSDYHIREVEK
jgi:hypothetical protein